MLSKNGDRRSVNWPVFSSACFQIPKRRAPFSTVTITTGSADYQRMSSCFLFFGDPGTETARVSVSRSEKSVERAEREREWAASVIVYGAEELSPAQTEPTNAISVSNTIVLSSQANAIMQYPVLQALSAHKPQGQTFGPTLRLIFDVDKTHTIAQSPLWPNKERGGTYCCFSVNWHEH